VQYWVQFLSANFPARSCRVVDGENDRLASIMAFLDKVSQACLVKIEVASHADTYTLWVKVKSGVWDALGMG
jgi:hypothetical protein